MSPGRMPAGAVVLLGLAGLAAWGSMSDEQGSLLADGDSSAIVQDADRLGVALSRVVSSPQRLDGIDRADSLLLLVEPPSPYPQGDLDALRAWLHDGGAILVADSSGHGTQVAALGGLALERVRLHDQAGAAPLLLGGMSLRLDLDDATAVHVAPGVSHAEILAVSSTRSFLDRDGDGAIGPGDPPGPFPLLVSAHVGHGTLWVLSAPEALLGGGPEHAAFRAALLASALDGRRSLVVDESRLESDDPLVVSTRAMLRGPTHPVGQVSIVLAGIVAVAAVAWMRARGSWAPHAFDPDRFLDGRPDAWATDAGLGGWSRRGLAAMGLAASLATCALAFGSKQAAWAAGFALAACAGAIAVRAPRGKAQRTVAQDRVGEGARVDVHVDVRLRGPRDEVQVRDALHPSMAVASGTVAADVRQQAAELRYEAVPTRLGLYQVGPLHVRRRDAFGLRVAQRELAPGTALEVMPRVEDARRTPFRSKVPQIISGSHPVQRAGSGAEFLALRDYHSGDSMRIVNWKASARSKSLVVNQRVHETPNDLTVLLDVRACTDVGPASRTGFVAGSRAAVGITAGAVRGRDQTRIVLYGDGVHRVAGRGADQQQRFLGQLAGTQAAGDTTLHEAVLGLLPELRAGRPVVIVTNGHRDATVFDAVLELRRRALRPFLVMPQAWGVPGNGGIDAHVARADLVARLRASGVPCYETRDGLGLEDAFRVLGGAA